MEPNNYAYYNIQSGLIENVIYITDEVAATLTWPEGYAIVKLPDAHPGEWSACGIGWSYINGQFVEPPAPAQPIAQGTQTL